MANLITKLKSYFMKLMFLGTDENHGVSTNRVIIFSNAMVTFGLVLSVGFYTQLLKLEVEKDVLSYYFFIIPASMSVYLFHYLNRIFLAHLCGVLSCIFYGWSGAYFFGKSFNGYQFLFVGLIYSVVTFSSYPLRVRLPIVLLTYLNIPILDYLSYNKIVPVTGFHSSHFPFELLVSDTLIIPPMMVIFIWIEKTMADRHESLLKNAFDTIREQKQKIQTIFDNISLEIIVTDKSQKLDQEYSKFVESLFEVDDPTQKELSELIFSNSNLSQEQISANNTTLDNSLGEDIINWTLNHDHLVKECHVTVNGNEKELKLSWTPITNNDIVEKVILTIDDATEENRAIRELAQQKAIEEKISDILRATSRMGLNGTLLFLEKVNRLALESTLGSNDKKSVLQDLHGVKGEARTMGFAKLSSKIHEVEDLINNSDTFNVRSVFNKVNFIEECKLLNEAKEKIFSETATKKPWMISEPLQQICVELNDQLNSKKTNIQLSRLCIDNRIQFWPPSLREDVTTILVHSIQNAVDHGYILPGLQRDIDLEVNCFKDKGFYVLQIKDGGNGLNLKKLQEKFDKLPAETQNSLQKVENIVFLDEVSTADSASLTSGRGIGMAAIKGMAERHGGSVEISNNSNSSGTTLTLILPTIEESQKHSQAA